MCECACLPKRVVRVRVHICPSAYLLVRLSGWLSTNARAHVHMCKCAGVRTFARRVSMHK